MYSHEFQIRVSYAETDQMGFMYYGYYARYYEIGRVEAIRALGISYKKLEKERGIILPVLYVESRFITPALYDELLTIRTSIREMPSKMIQFYTEIFNEENQLIHKALVKLFFIEKVTNKRISAPGFFIELLKPYFEE